MNKEKIIKRVDQINMIDNNLLKSILVEINNREGDSIKQKIQNSLKNDYMPLVFEATEYNIYTEYMAMKNFIDERGFSGNYEKGRFKTLEFMINCIIADPIDGNYYNKENAEIIKEAGRLLHSEDAMNDDLVWLFVPKRLGRDIDVLWDGIGGWRG